MKVRIEPPKGSKQQPYEMEFKTYGEYLHYLSQINDEIYWADPATEELSFRPSVID